MNPSSFSRWIIVPFSCLILFGIGYGIAYLIGLVWSGMPLYVRWGIPSVLVVWYLWDSMRSER